MPLSQDLAYAFNLPNGNYTVEISAAESLFSGTQERVFDILLQGNVAYSYFDPLAWAGGKNRAVSASTPNVTVTNGLLLVTLVPRVYEPSIRAIRVYDSDEFTALPPPPPARSINCGGGDYRSADGTAWEGDKYFTIDAGPIDVLQFIAANATAPANITTRTGRALLQVNASLPNATLSAPIVNVTASVANVTAPVTNVTAPVANVTAAAAPNNTLPDNATLAANITPDNTTVEIQQLYPVPVTYSGPDARLYLTGRTENDFQYLLNVPNGDYVLELHFCEFIFSKPAQRIFTVKVNNVPAVTQLDLVATVGYNVPLVVRKPVTITNGLLRLEFIGDVLFGSLKSNATVSGIKYYPNTNATGNFSLGIDSGSIMDVLSGLGIVYKVRLSSSISLVVLSQLVRSFEFEVCSYRLQTSQFFTCVLIFVRTLERASLKES
jgi:beta-galactosidase